MEKSHTAKAIAFIVIGAIMALFGAWNLFVGAGVSSADRLQCEEIVREKYANVPEALATMLPKCDEPGMVAMMKASQSNASAQVAAKNIASANKQGFSSTLIGGFCLGLGAVLLIAGIPLLRKKEPENSKNSPIK
ncbi:hypothetical protein CSB09_03610 [Candidatus Gracilibacteria bacterium]|nr:MAG: hypothetical protein CSB09_03610 [Candidatus Gracilibacteria bacterium]